MKFDYPDTTTARYWQAVNKLTTRAFNVMNEYGVMNREVLAEMRDMTAPLGAKYEPIEIFTDEENQRFEEHQALLFKLFGHGMGAVNDQLYALKMHAERTKRNLEFLNFTDYMTNPNNEFRDKDRVPFADIVEAITFALSGVVRRFFLYNENKERIQGIIENFFAWRNGYANLKEQGAPADKLEKYLYLEQKFIDLVEFMSFDNLLYVKRNKKPAPFDTALAELNTYRDNLDDPDAERNFKYKIRGLTNIIYKAKEYIFIYQFADLETGKNYRPPEEIAAAEAAAKLAAEQQENPADIVDEA